MAETTKHMKGTGDSTGPAVEEMEAWTEGEARETWKALPGRRCWRSRQS